MYTEITVREVDERNDCAGKKLIYVTSCETDELIPTHYRLTRQYMFPDQKLALASVASDDRVIIIANRYSHDVAADTLVAGEYIDNLENLFLRAHLCVCGTEMISDGVDVYCPNIDCALTLAARLTRLSDATFYAKDDNDNHADLNDFNSLPTLKGLNYCKPFHPIVQGMFWGYSDGSLGRALLSKKKDHLSIATFLVRPLFEEFINNNAMISSGNIVSRGEQYTTEGIYRFFSDMEELVNRRNTKLERQNRLIHQFIWSLGIESLGEMTIFGLTQFERISELSLDPMLTYAYLLTHSSELINEIGLHPAEAISIVSEVKRRRHEFCDIFLHYCHNQQDVHDCFNNIT